MWAEVRLIDGLDVLAIKDDKTLSIAITCDKGTVAMDGEKVLFEGSPCTWSAETLVAEGFAIGPELEKRIKPISLYAPMTEKQILEADEIFELHLNEHAKKAIEESLKAQADVVAKTLKTLEIDEMDDILVPLQGHIPGWMIDDEEDDIFGILSTINSADVKNDQASDISLEEMFAEMAATQHTSANPAPGSFHELDLKASQAQSSAYTMEMDLSSDIRADQAFSAAMKHQDDHKKSLKSRIDFMAKLIEDIVKRSTESDMDDVESLVNGMEHALGYGDKKANATNLVIRRLAADADIRIGRIKNILNTQKCLCSDISAGSKIDRKVLVRAANAHMFLEGFRAAVRGDADFQIPLTGRLKNKFAHLGEAACLTPQEILDTPGVGPVTLERILDQIRAIGKPCPALCSVMDENGYNKPFVSAYTPWSGESIVQKVASSAYKEMWDLEVVLNSQISNL